MTQSKDKEKEPKKVEIAFNEDSPTGRRRWIMLPLGLLDTKKERYIWRVLRHTVKEKDAALILYKEKWNGVWLFDMPF